MRIRAAKYVLIDEVLYKRGFSQPYLRCVEVQKRIKQLTNRPKEIEKILGPFHTKNGERVGSHNKEKKERKGPEGWDPEERPNQRTRQSPEGRTGPESQKPPRGRGSLDARRRIITEKLKKDKRQRARGPCDPDTQWRYRAKCRNLFSTIWRKR